MIEYCGTSTKFVRTVTCALCGMDLTGTYLCHHLGKCPELRRSHQEETTL